MTEKNTLLTPKEVAVVLQCSVSTVRQMVRDGDLKRAKHASSLLIPAKSVWKLISLGVLEEELD